MDDWKGAVVVPGALLLILFVGLFFGFGMGTQAIREQAVKNGSAVWVADDSGNTSFQWKPAGKGTLRD